MSPCTYALPLLQNIHPFPHQKNARGWSKNAFSPKCTEVAATKQLGEVPTFRVIFWEYSVGRTSKFLIIWWKRAILNRKTDPALYHLFRIKALHHASEVREEIRFSA